MNRWLLIVSAVLLAPGSGFPQTQTTARSMSKVPPPRRFNQTVPAYDVQMETKPPEETQRTDLDAAEREIRRERDESYLDEPVTMRAPLMRERPRPYTDKENKEKDWLEIGDKKDNGREISWGWLADGSREAANERKNRENELASKQYEELNPLTLGTNGSPTKESARTFSQVNEGRAQSPGGGSGEMGNRQRASMDADRWSLERGKPVDSAPAADRYENTRGAWFPDLVDARTPSPDAGYRADPKPPMQLSPMPSYLTPSPMESRDSRQAGGWTPLRIEAIPSWTPTASTPGAPTGLPSVETPKFGSGSIPLGGSGLEKPALAPTPTPGLDIRSVGQRSPLDSVGAKPVFR